MLRRKTLHLVLLIMGILSMSTGQASILSSAPHWLNGTLLFNTAGLDRTLYPKVSPANQYVFAADFDADRITSKSVVSNSVLSMDPDNGNVFLFNTNKPGLHADEYNSRKEWKIFECEFIGVKEGKIVFQPERIVTDLKYYPVSVLCLSIEENGAMEAVYYRSVVDKDTDNAELQLILEKGNVNQFGYDHEVSMLKSFDAQNAFQDMRYAFSNKSVAINDGKGNLYIINKGDTSIVECPETKYVIGALSWLDDDTLVYCTNESHGWIAGEKGLKALHIWNVKTGKLSSLSSLWGENKEYIIASDSDPMVLTINHDKSIIALYLPGNGLSNYFEDRIGKILLVSALNGEQFEIIPWTEYESNEENLQISEYNTSDDGIIIFDPTGLADLNLVWN